MNREECHNNLRGKKFVFVFGNLELGGAERQGLMLARYLKERHGADVRVLGLQENPGTLSRLCDQSGLPWRGVKLSWRWELRHLPADLLELNRIAALVRREKPDVLLPYTFFPNVLCGLIWRFTGAALCIWNQRDEGFFLEPEFWRRLAARLTPYFIANSGEGRDALLRAFSIPAERIAVIRNGVMLEPPGSGRREWREKLSLSDGVPAACMVANLHGYKDHDTLLRAWADLPPLLPSGTPAPVLLLAGRADQGEGVRALAGTLGLGDCVRFLGEVRDVPGLLQAVDFCVHSSRSEGLCNAVLEAMAAGLPVAATDIPGIREAVGPDGMRFLAPVGDVKGLAGCMAELARDPALRAEVGERMRRRVREEFAAESCCRLAADFVAERLT